MEDKKEEKKEQTSPILEPIVPDSMKQLVNLLEETVRMVVDVEKYELKPGVSFPEVMKDLQLIKKAVAAMADDQKDLSEYLDSLKEQYGPVPPAEKILGKEDQAVLEKLKKLETICEGARERIHDEMLKNPQTVERAKEILEESSSSTKRKSIKRKRKFRSMGGEQGGWVKT